MDGNLSRRLFIGAGASAAAGLIAFPDWYARYGAARAQAPAVRYSVKTPQGAAMLAKYSTAVAAMMARGPGDPCSWLFQWYTHQIRSDRDKGTEVLTLPTAQQALANDMWNTCQAHAGRPAEYFLPWHRMYVYFLERIVRRESGDPAFTLPYWDYLDSSQRALPTPFWTPASGPLFRPDRNAGSNAGNPIDGGAIPSPINQDCLKQGTFLPDPAPGGDIGFSAAIDGVPHGIVHSLTGNLVGMGRVPWAANDPIFWLHHCNIDRMWASWNAGGGKNPTDPTWLAQTFVFADENCNRVVMKVEDVLKLDDLDYRYDRLIPIVNISLIERLRKLIRIAAWPPRIPRPGDPPPWIELAARPVTVTLRPALERGLAARRLAGAQRVKLVVRNLRTNIEPGIIYDVYLNLPANLRANVRASARRAYYAGSLSFFEAETMSHEGHAAAQSGGPSFSFDVTKAARRLNLASRVDVTIVPNGRPAAEARPAVANIELLAG